MWMFVECCCFILLSVLIVVVVALNERIAEREVQMRKRDVLTRAYCEYTSIP